jgi:lysophospholipase L1-like esterase
VAIPQPYQLAESDPLSFHVDFHEEVYVSFEADGALAASAINLFPGSYSVAGHHAGDIAIGTGTPQYRAAGLATLYVEGAPTRAFVAIGDSITEGYIEGGDNRTDDYRTSWPFVGESALGIPVVNAAVSGQGTYDEVGHVSSEVLSMHGITDCVVVLGTNDLGTGAGEIERWLGKLFEELRPFCRVWGGTLPPKDQSRAWSDRTEVNNWLRTRPGTDGLVDCDSSLGVAPTFNTWLPGYTVDGIHPTVQGNEAIGNCFSSAVSQGGGG